MTITANDIKSLREKTGAGMMDCKAALVGANGNVDQAIVILRKNGLAGITERQEKTASEGMIGHYIHTGGKIGVLVEINTETDFSSRSDDFKQFSKDLAMHIAATNPKWINRSEVSEDFISKEKEIIAPTLKDKPPAIAEKMTNGKLDKVFKELCLMEQPFVKDPSINISDLLGNLAAKIGEKIIIKRFVRFVTGE